METSASSMGGSEPRNKQAIAVVKARAEEQTGSNMTDLREARGSIEGHNGPFTPGPLSGVARCPRRRNREGGLDPPPAQTVTSSDAVCVAD